MNWDNKEKCKTPLEYNSVNNYTNRSIYKPERTSNKEIITWQMKEQQEQQQWCTENC